MAPPSAGRRGRCTRGRSSASRSKRARVVSCVSAGDERITSVGSTPSWIRISTSGQYVMPSPYDSARPRATAAMPSTRSRKSCTSLDLPTPAGPIRVKIRQALRSTTWSNSARSRSRSRSRPINGLRRSLATPPALRSRTRSRDAATADDFPLSSSSSGSTRTASRTSCSVSSPSRISPGPAACSSRAATLTASPVTSVSPSPATTAPVFTPMRGSRPRAWTTSRSSTAERTARSASSSVATGIPNTAITASPTNFSTVPPWRSSTTRAAS